MHYTHIAMIITLAVAISYLNHRFIKLHSTIAVMASALILSILCLLVSKLGIYPLHEKLEGFITHIDFHSLVMNFMLGLLLFAGALTIDLTHLKKLKLEVAILSIFSTIASAFIIAALLYLFIVVWLGYSFPFIYAFLFGSLISPTDPIAVLAIFKQVGASKNLETLVSAEALFNDGVGVVLFVTSFAIAFTTTTQVTASSVVILFLREAVGGLVYGVVLGWVVANLMKAIDDSQVEILLSIALVTGGYTLAQRMGISGPLAMVASGIFIANYKRETLMSAFTRRRLESFWELIDELLNIILFLLLGFEILLVHFTPIRVVIGACAIPIVMFSRYITVAIPTYFFKKYRGRQEPYTLSILTWGGLRGGLAVALALTVPSGVVRTELLVLTYSVVLFSILVQGLTIKSLVQKSIIKKQ